MEPERFRMIVNAHQHSAYAAAFRVLGNHHDAWDVAQDTFLALYERAAQVDGERVAGWLVRVATNRAIDRVRRLSRMRLVSDTPDKPEQQAPGPLTIASADEERSSVHEALARLPIRQREVVTLRMLQQMTFPELSGLLGISEGAAKVHFRRGILALRKLLAPPTDREGTSHE